MVIRALKKKGSKFDEEEYRVGLDFVINSLQEQESGMPEGGITEVFDRVTAIFQDRVREYPKEVKENYQLYVYFCEHVVKELLIETAIS